MLIGSFRNIRLRETLFREPASSMLPSLLPNVFPNMRGSGGACGLLRVPLAKLPAAPACSFPHATTSTFLSDWPSTLDKRPALRRRNACGRINPTWDSGLALDDAPALPVLSDAVCLMGLPFASSKSIARLTSCSARGQVSMILLGHGDAQVNGEAFGSAIGRVYGTAHLSGDEVVNGDRSS